MVNFCKTMVMSTKGNLVWVGENRRGEGNRDGLKTYRKEKMYRKEKRSERTEGIFPPPPSIPDGLPTYELVLINTD